MAKSSKKSGRAKPAPSTKCDPTNNTNTLSKTSNPSEADAVAQLIAWILAGHGELDLAEALGSYFPKHDPRKLLERAAAHYQEAGRSDAVALRGFCIEAYREIYRKALDIGDYTTALKALARLETTAGKAAA